LYSKIESSATSDKNELSDDSFGSDSDFADEIAMTDTGRQFGKGDFID